MLIQADDPRISWQGVISLQNLNGSVKPWRLRHDELDFYNPALHQMAAMTSGVRLRFRTDAASLKINFSHTVESRVTVNRHGEEIPLPGCLIETFVDGKRHSLDDIADDAENLSLENLPPGTKNLEIYLPLNCTFVLHAIELPAAALFESFEDKRPRWIHYGSSISHCVRAESPAQSWPAIVAAKLGLNLTSLGFGGQCKLDPSVAITIRDLPADLISLKLGINTYVSDLSPLTFRAAGVGYVRIIREKHPVTPLVICSPICSPPRETVPGVSGQTLVQMRETLADIVEMFRRRGDRHIYYLDGLKLFGPELAGYLPDELHPDAEGMKLMAGNFLNEFKLLKLQE